MRLLSHRVVGFALGFSFLLATGCSERTLPVPKTHPASGKLTIKGEPASFVIISLKPRDNKSVLARGTTKEDGTFDLRTYSNGEPDGAVPGEYTVVLEGFDPVRGGKIPAGSKPTAIPGGEMDTGISVEIKDGDNDLTIEVP